jgi:eukaryotic-like serine/threonine-protein kinase
VVLNARDFVGRPVEDVAAQLASYGLTVRRTPDPSADAAPGTVTAVDPTGTTLRPGDVVTLSYVVGPALQPVHGGTRVPGTAATGRATTVVTAPTSAAPVTSKAAGPPVLAGTPTGAAPTSTSTSVSTSTPPPPPAPGSGPGSGSSSGSGTPTSSSSAAGTTSSSPAAQ